MQEPLIEELGRLVGEQHRIEESRDRSVAGPGAPNPETEVRFLVAVPNITLVVQRQDATL